MTTIPSFSSALHNKNIYRIAIQFYSPIQLFDILKNIQMIFEHSSQDNPIGHVTSPIVTGGAVIALKCKEGVIIATDTLLSYGGLLKYTGVNRYQQIQDNVIVTATGQYADYQEATRKLRELSHQTFLFDDGVKHTVKDYANYLAKLCYQKRNKQNPYYNNFVVAGYQNGKAYLSSIDLYGNHIAKDYITAGFSKYFGHALIANQWNPNKTIQQCKVIMHKCFTVLYERDCKSIDQLQFATVTAAGVQVLAPQHVASNWDFKDFRNRKNQKLWQ